MRPNWTEYFLEVAGSIAKRSTCCRLKVGCVITYDNKIVTTGYNGATSGEAHCTEVGCHLVDGHCKRTIHAERNALGQLKESNSRMKLYVTHEPCALCRIEIEKHHIREIHWSNDYNGVTKC